jgi:hypothetical protein
MTRNVLTARSSRGISVQGGKIAKTIIGKAASTVPGLLVDIGDGIGLFEGTGDVQLDTVTFDSNQRSQMLVDTGSTGLTVKTPTLTSQAGQLGVVVQRTTEVVVAPMIFTPLAGQELDVSAFTLGLPPR